MPISFIPQTIKNRVKNAIIRGPSKDVAENFLRLEPSGIEKLTESLKEHYFKYVCRYYDLAESPDAYFETEAGGKDLDDHLFGRLDGKRERVVPWLNDARPLKGARILEIGCGTGSSTVALAEQGAEVTAVDIDEHSLQVAKDRCHLYGLAAEFHIASATEIKERFGGRSFDFIIFFATLEHLTPEERMTAMKGAWEMLSPGCCWCVTEAPNRLWYFDYHTSFLPFNWWLPDELSHRYSKFSPREGFNSAYKKPFKEVETQFYRWGRGLSFHEFDLTMRKTEDLEVVSSLESFLRDRNPLYKLLNRFTDACRFETFLRKIGPPLHTGFYQSYLDLIIRKS